MFENTPSKTAPAPEDIFSGVDEASAPPIPSPTPHPTNIPLVAPTSEKPLPPGLGKDEHVSLPPMPPSPPSTLHPPTSKKKLLFLALIILLVVIAAALLGAWLLRARTPVIPEPVEDQTLDVTVPLEEILPTPTDEEVVIEEEPETAVPAAPAAPVDTDRDGLTDEEEVRLGTATRSADTDNDTLSDSDEIKVWGTDPLNPDTDGDSYIDGAEVTNGYNPKGSGKLLPETP